MDIFEMCYTEIKCKLSIKCRDKIDGDSLVNQVKNILRKVSLILSSVKQFVI